MPMSTRLPLPPPLPQARTATSTAVHAPVATSAGGNSGSALASSMPTEAQRQHADSFSPRWTRLHEATAATATATAAASLVGSTADCAASPRNGGFTAQAHQLPHTLAGGTANGRADSNAPPPSAARSHSDSHATRPQLQQLAVQPYATKVHVSLPPRSDCSTPSTAAAVPSAPSHRRLVRKHGRFQLWASGVLLSLSLCHTILGLATDSWIENEDTSTAGSASVGGDTHYRSVHGKQQLQWILVSAGLVCGLAAYVGLVTRFFGWQLAVRSHSIVSAKALIILCLVADAACLFAATESYTTLAEYASTHPVAAGSNVSLVHGSAFVLTKDSAYYVLVCIVLLSYHEFDEMRRLRQKKNERERVLREKQMRRGQGQLQHGGGDGSVAPSPKSHPRQAGGAGASASLPGHPALASGDVDVEMGRSAPALGPVPTRHDGAPATGAPRERRDSASSDCSADSGGSGASGAKAPTRKPGGNGSSTSSSSSPFHIVLHHDYLSPPQRRFVFAVSTFFLVVYLGALVFSAIEGWNIRVSADFCLTTLATIGYGNTTPSSTLGRCVLFIYFPVGFASLGFAVNLVWQVVLAKLNSRVRRASAVLANWIGGGWVGRKLGLAAPAPVSVGRAARTVAKIRVSEQQAATAKTGSANGARPGDRFVAPPPSTGMAPPARRPPRSRSPTPPSSASSSRSQSPTHDHERVALTAVFAQRGANANGNGGVINGRDHAAPPRRHSLSFFELPSRNARLELERQRAAGGTRARDMPVTHEEHELMHQHESTDHDHDADTECATDHEAPVALDRAQFLASNRLRMPTLGERGRTDSGDSPNAASAAGALLHDLQPLRAQLATLAAMQHPHPPSSTRTTAPPSATSSTALMSSDTDSHDHEHDHDHDHEHGEHSHKMEHGQAHDTGSNRSSISGHGGGAGIATAMLLDKRSGSAWRSSSTAPAGAKRDDGAMFDSFSALHRAPPPPPPAPPAIPAPLAGAERPSQEGRGRSSKPASNWSSSNSSASSMSSSLKPSSGGATSLAASMSALQRKQSATSVQLLLAFGFVLAWVLLSSAVFSHTENMPYFTAFYFCYVTLTTIGFGDVVATRAVTSSFFLWFLIFGLGAVIYVLSLVGEVLTQRFEQQVLQRRKLKAARAKKRALREEMKTQEAIFTPPLALLRQAEEFSVATQTLLERARASVDHVASAGVFSPVELLRYQQAFSALVRAEEKRRSAFEQAWIKAMQRAHPAHSSPVASAPGHGPGPTGSGAADAHSPSRSVEHDMDWSQAGGVFSYADPEMIWQVEQENQLPCTCAPQPALFNQQHQQPAVPQHPGQPYLSSSQLHGPLHSQASRSGLPSPQQQQQQHARTGSFTFPRQTPLSPQVHAHAPNSVEQHLRRYLHHPPHSLHPYMSVPASVRPSASAPVSPQTAARRLMAAPAISANGHSSGCPVSLAAAGLLMRSPPLRMRSPMGHSRPTSPMCTMGAVMEDDGAHSPLRSHHLSSAASQPAASFPPFGSSQAGRFSHAHAGMDARTPFSSQQRARRLPPATGHASFGARQLSDHTSAGASRWSFRPRSASHSSAMSDDDGTGSVSVVQGCTGGATVADDELGFRAGSELDSDEENVVTERQANTNEEFEQHDEPHDDEEEHHDEEAEHEDAQEENEQQE